MSTQALSAPISSLSLLLVQTQTARWKIVTPDQLTGAHLYLDMALVRLLLSCSWECYEWCEASVRIPLMAKTKLFHNDSFQVNICVPCPTVHTIYCWFIASIFHNHFSICCHCFVPITIHFTEARHSAKLILQDLCHDITLVKAHYYLKL